MAYSADVTYPVLLERLLTLILFSIDLSFLVLCEEPPSEKCVTSQAREDGNTKDYSCTVRNEADDIERHGGTPAIRSWDEYVNRERTVSR